mgnify:CR=1 FL=1
MHNLTGYKNSLHIHSADNNLARHVCNMDYLISITRGNRKIIDSIVSVFFEETKTELYSLKVAIADANYSVVSSISHKLKSAFLLMGITVLKPVFDEMEQLGSATSGIERIAHLNNIVNKIFTQAKKELKGDWEKL